jgi:hypothetical protein
MDMSRDAEDQDAEQSPLHSMTKGAVMRYIWIVINCRVARTSPFHKCILFVVETTPININTRAVSFLLSLALLALLALRELLVLRVLLALRALWGQWAPMALLASLAFRNLHVSVGTMRNMKRTMKRNK